MNTKPDNIRSIDGGRSNTEPGAETAVVNAAQPEPAAGKPGRDYAKWSMVLSALALALVVIFFFALTQNVTGVAGEVEALDNLRTQVEGLQALVQGTNQYVSGLDERLGALEETQSKLVRQAVFQGLLSDMRMKAAALAGAVSDPAQAEKLAQLRQLLDEIQVPEQ